MERDTSGGRRALEAGPTASDASWAPSLRHGDEDLTLDSRPAGAFPLVPAIGDDGYAGRPTIPVNASIDAAMSVGEPKGAPQKSVTPADRRRRSTACTSDVLPTTATSAGPPAPPRPSMAPH